MRTRAERQKLLELVDLYLVTGEEFSKGRTTPQIVDAAVRAGCRMIQLREKKMEKGELYRLAVEVRRRYPEILLIVNDHLDVAMAAGADGVHLGQQDLPVAAARTVAPELIIGASSHSLEQALDAEKAGADYVNIGPIFPTGTKPHSEFLGPETIARISPHLGVQFTVMGGIGPENIEDVLRAGARIVAVVTAVCAAPDPQAAARLLRQKILEFR